MSYSLAIITADLITLYSYIDRETETRVHVCAKLPNQDYDGNSIYLLDWKVEGPACRITYQHRNDAYAPVFDITAPVVKDTFALKRPNRSKNWKLDQYGDYWRNAKTGQKVYL